MRGNCINDIDSTYLVVIAVLWVVMQDAAMERDYSGRNRRRQSGCSVPHCYSPRGRWATRTCSLRRVCPGGVAPESESVLCVCPKNPFNGITGLKLKSSFKMLFFKFSHSKCHLQSSVYMLEKFLELNIFGSSQIQNPYATANDPYA